MAESPQDRPELDDDVTKEREVHDLQPENPDDVRGGALLEPKPDLQIRRPQTG